MATIFTSAHTFRRYDDEWIQVFVRSSNLFGAETLNFLLLGSQLFRDSLKLKMAYQFLFSIRNIQLLLPLCVSCQFYQKLSHRFFPATFVLSSRPVFFCLDHLMNAWVEVCTSAEGSCSQCGQKAGSTGPTQWVAFPCDEPLEGSVVKVIGENMYMGFCEVEIITSEIGDVIFPSDVDENFGSEEETQSDNEASPSNGDDGGFNPLDLITTE